MNWTLFVFVVESLQKLKLKIILIFGVLFGIVLDGAIQLTKLMIMLCHLKNRLAFIQHFPPPRFMRNEIPWLRLIVNLCRLFLNVLEYPVQYSISFSFKKILNSAWFKISNVQVERGDLRRSKLLFRINHGLDLKAAMRERLNIESLVNHITINQL